MARALSEVMRLALIIGSLWAALLCADSARVILAHGPKPAPLARVARDHLGER